MNIAPEYRTPRPRKSRSKRPAHISPENWRVVVCNLRRLGYALYRGWMGERSKAMVRAAALRRPDIFGGLKHL
jgi:hypothetical protein